MTVKKPDNSDDATDEDYINDKTDEDYPEDAFHEVHIYDETNEDYSDEDFFMARPMKIILRTQLMKIVLTLNFHVGSRTQPPLCSVLPAVILAFFYISQKIGCSTPTVV